MKYLHTMVRVRDIDASLDFYCNKLGLKEIKRKENEKGRLQNSLFQSQQKLSETQENQRQQNDEIANRIMSFHKTHEEEEKRNLQKNFE